MSALLELLATASLRLNQNVTNKGLNDSVS